MPVPPTDPRRGSASSQDHRPPGWDPRARSSSGDRHLPPPRAESGRLAPPDGQLAGSAVTRTRRVGPYRLLGLIAQGGMGAVYQAFHEGLGRTVALKTMLPAAAQSLEDVERFLREAKAASRLTHRNLVPIYDVGDADGVRYLAMELVRGETLHERIRQKGRLDDGQSIAVLIGATEGLAHAHEAGVLHRDLKPANIILEPDGTPRVTDFGVAKAVGESRLTATGTALGTPNYMSPEQAMGLNEQLDARTDVWGLGAILYECLTGQPPFNEGSQVATMQAVVSRGVTAPRLVHPDVSRDLEAICLKCLAREREERYPSCQELLRDLRACQAGRTIRARPAGAVGRLARRVKRNAVIASLATLSAGSLLALVVVLAAGRRASAPVRLDPQAEAELWLEARRAELNDPQRRAALDSTLSGLEVPAGAPLGLALPGPAAALRQLRAELWRASAEASQGPSRLAGLARAAALAPESRAGRAARLALVLELEARSEAACRELLLAELSALAGGADEVAQEAALRLVPRLLEAARWEEALALASPDHPLRPLAAALAPALSAGADAAVALPGRQPTLLLRRGSEVLRWTPGGASYPTPAYTCRPEGSVRALEARSPAAGSSEARVLLIEQRPGGDVALQPLSPGGAPPSPRLVRLAHPHDACRWAVGDYDGDGSLDAVGIPWSHTASAVAASSLPAGPSWRVFSPEERADQLAQLPYLVNVAEAIDLDGDGRDELVLGSSPLRPAGVVVRRLTGDTFRTSCGLPLPAAVSALGAWPLDGARQGLLVVVDWAVGQELHMLDYGRPEGLPSWAGRDGLYLLEETGGRLELRAHWTWGPDAPLSAATVGLAERVQGWVMRLGGVPWVARAAELAAGPRLELIRLSALLEGGQAPELALDLRELPSAPPQVVDVDGDGEDELLWGGRLLGAGAQVTPARSQDPPRAAQVRMARVVAAAAPEALPELIATLEAVEPGQAGEARLAGAEVPLALAGEARGAAARALARGLRDEGQARWVAAAALLEQAGQAAAALAMRGDELPLRERAEAALLAEEAWGRLGRREQAAACLARVAAQPGLPSSLLPRLTAAERRTPRDGRAEAWVAELGGRGPRALAPFSPLGAHLLQGALRVDVCGHRVEGACARVELPEGPLVLEAVLRLEGPAWVGRVEVGLFDGTPEDLGAAKLTGLQVDLWSVYAGRPAARLVTDGASTGSLGWLPSFQQRLRARLELTPLPDGVRTTLTVEDARGGGLLLASERHSPGRLPSGRALVGVRCPAYPRREEAAVEHGIGFLGGVVIESLRLSASPAPAEVEHGPLARGDLALLHGAPGEALAAYEEAMAQDELPPAARHAAFWRRALAGGRGQDHLAHEQLVQAAELDPLATLLALEDAADALLFGGQEEDRLTVARALEAMSQHSDPLLQVMADALRGRPLSRAEPLAGLSLGRMQAYGYALLMAHPGADPSELEPTYTTHGLRLPRHPWAPTLDYPLAPLSDQERRELGARVDREQGPREVERRLVRLATDRPREIGSWSGLARFQLQVGNTQRAELCYRRLIELSPDAWGPWLQVAELVARRNGDDEAVLDALEAAVQRGMRRSDLEGFVQGLQVDPLRGGLLRSPRLEDLRRRAK